MGSSEPSSLGWQMPGGCRKVGLDWQVGCSGDIERDSPRGLGLFFSGKPLRIFEQSYTLERSLCWQSIGRVN